MEGREEDDARSEGFLFAIRIFSPSLCYDSFFLFIIFSNSTTLPL